MARKPTNDGGYTVGYGKPPAATRFKPGQSGNPAGRRRGVRNLATDLDEVRSRQVTITEEGRQRRVSVQYAALLGLASRALKGDVRATDQLTRLIERHCPDEIADTTDGGPGLSTQDNEILRAFLARQTSQQQS